MLGSVEGAFDDGLALRVAEGAGPRSRRERHDTSSCPASKSVKSTSTAARRKSTASRAVPLTGVQSGPVSKARTLPDQTAVPATGLCPEGVPSSPSCGK